MWKLKQFMPKEPAGLEGRLLDVGSLKVQVGNAIAEGGFSSVYLARDPVNSSKLYALKHMVCQDNESLDLAMKEISVMKTLKGHPNVVTLVAHTILDMGRTKQALLVMEFCEKSLVTVLENRGAGYFEEQKVLLIFRDVCNAVFAMHCQSPPIAHRDLKAENVLLGADSAWKLCDFGSVSTNHKCFSKPEEMGIEEDNIRKYTTPAYRAPEMWDLYRREVISEKVDIWALGCLLYRICYLKSAFDGESKLQILNGNYRIPESPKYNSAIISLIKDMLQSSPDARPDITQVWFRVNEILPLELQKDLPDSCSPGSTANGRLATQNVEDEAMKRTGLMPRFNLPHPSSTREHVETEHSRSTQNASKVSSTGSPLGAFWSTEHAQDSQFTSDEGPVFDKAPVYQLKPKKNLTSSSREPRAISPPRNSIKGHETELSKDFEISFSPSGLEYVSEKTKVSNVQKKDDFHDDAFNAFVAEFDTSKLNSRKASNTTKGKSNLDEQDLDVEINRLQQELKQVNLEKEEMTSKYEKLSAICRSQQQEIQGLKSALSTANASLVRKEISKPHPSGTVLLDTLPREKIEGATAKLSQGIFANSMPEASPEATTWSAFDEKVDEQSVSRSSHPKSVRTVSSSNSRSNKEHTSSSSSGTWGFDQDSFTATPSPASITSKPAVGGSASQRFTSANRAKIASLEKPAGWAGF